MGRTFNGQEVESLEYHLGFRWEGRGGIDKRYNTLKLVFWELLRKHSLDLAASEARIEELKQIPEDEYEKYCC